MDEINKTILNHFQQVRKHHPSSCKEIDILQQNYEVEYVALARKMSAAKYSSQKKREEILQLIGESKILEGINEYLPLKLPVEVQKLPDVSCSECSSPLLLSTHSGMLECYICGEDRMYMSPHVSMSDTNNPSTFSNFKPIRHLKGWLDCILGKENIDNIITPQLIARILDKAKKKSFIIEFLTVDDVRNILKDLNESNLNKYISSILKQITKKPIPEISEDSYQITYSLFMQVMEARETIKDKNKSNRIYYPFYIYKIFDVVLIGDERKILKYIHLHSYDTLCEDDAEWFQICSIVPYLQGKYRPTSIN